MLIPVPTGGAVYATEPDVKVDVLLVTSKLATPFVLL